MAAAINDELALANSAAAPWARALVERTQAEHLAQPTLRSILEVVALEELAVAEAKAREFQSVSENGRFDERAVWRTLIQALAYDEIPESPDRRGERAEDDGRERSEYQRRRGR